MKNFILDISNIGNDKNQDKSYYNRLTDYITNQGYLTADDCHELVSRVEDFIMVEIQKIRFENHQAENPWHGDGECFEASPIDEEIIS